MSIEIMALVFAIKNQLTPTEKLILLELADHANDKGNGIWPGLDTITDRTSLDRKTVRGTLDWLTKTEILSTESLPTAHKSTRRCINVEYLRELKQAGEHDQKHPLLVMARSAYKAAQQTKKGENGSRGGASHPQEIDENTALGVSDSPPEGELVTPRGGASHPRGGVSTPESSIKHHLNIKETEGLTQPDATYLWKQIDQQLSSEMAMSAYATWVRSLTPVTIRDGTLEVAAVNAYSRDWCQERLGVKVSRLASALAGMEISVQFCLASSA